jgi:aubergine-like protein
MFSHQPTGEWSGVCKNAELVYSIPLKHWLLVYTSKSAQVAQELAQNLTYVGSSVGLAIDKPHLVELPDDRKTSFIEGIKSNVQEYTQCVVCILPNSNKERYDSIKKTCSVELAIPSQCVVAK